MQGGCQTGEQLGFAITYAFTIRYMITTNVRIADPARIPVVLTHRVVDINHQHLRRRWSLLGGIRYAQFREAVAQRVAREAQSAGGLAFVAGGVAQGFPDGFVFPLFECDAGRQDVG